MRSFALMVVLLSSLSFLTSCQSKSSSPGDPSGEASSGQGAGPTAAEVEQFLIESNAVINKDSGGDINRLHLEGTEITNEDLSKLKVLKGLRRLYLDESTNDAGLKHLKELTGLQQLYLIGADVTDEGVENLAGLSELTNLDLTRTRITDNGLKHVAQLKRLKMLSLSDTAVSNRGLEYLKGLEKLIVLDLTDTDVSVEGSIELKKSLTKLSVRR